MICVLSYFSTNNHAAIVSQEKSYIDAIIVISVANFAFFVFWESKLVPEPGSLSVMSQLSTILALGA